jgi:hypothetical protein
MIGYNANQRRRFIPQYLIGDALKWHLSHRDQLEHWEAYHAALVAAFPYVETTSRDMNLKLLRDRKQGVTESFTDYYTSILGLCRKHDADMTDLQILDWLKAGMSIQLYERLQGEEFTTPQDLLRRAQRVELDNAVLDARKREYTSNASHNKSSSTTTRSSNYLPRTSSPFTPSYPPPLMSTPPTPTPHAAHNFPPPSAPSTFDPSARPRRPIICFSCHQPGHISTQCPSRPVICYSCHQPGHISPNCPSHPNV